MKFFGAFGGQKTDMAEFTQQVLAGVRSRCGIDIAIDANSLEMRANSISRFGLDKSFQKWKAASRKDRESVLASTVEMIVAALQDADPQTVRARLRVDVKWAFQIWQVRLQVPTAPETIDRRLMPGFVASVVVDQSSSVSRPSIGKLAEWGLSKDEAFEIGLSNLRAISHDAWVSIRPNLVRSGWGDEYQAARLLLHDLIHRAPIEGDPVIAFPTRSDLFVASARDADAVAEMMRLAFEAWDKSEYRLDSRAWWLIDGNYEAFRLPAELQNAAMERSILQRAAGYDAQQQFFSRLAGITVPKLRALKMPNGEVRTSTHFSGGKALVPPADGLLLIQPEKPSEAVEVLWEDAERVLGPFVAMEGCYPERFWIDRAFPSGEELETLQSLSARLRERYS